MNPIVVAVLPAALAFIMFGLGLNLTLDDFRRVLTRPKAIALGILAQCVLLPLTAFGISTWLELSPQLAVGLMILSACPGGVTAAVITDLARGDTCLSISLTAITSVITFLTLPLIVAFSLAHFMGHDAVVNYPVGQAISGLFVITFLPVALGLWLRHREWLSASSSKLIRQLANGVFLLVVIFTFVAQWSDITQNLERIGGAILLLNVITMLTGAGLGRLSRLPVQGTIALAVECGIQNSALGIAVAMSLLGDPKLAVPSVVYAFLMNITALLLIALRNWLPTSAQSRKQASSQARD
jgi:BASS family bile acid:Na+ symporter